jgi:predicted transposase YbfD/YdcC
VAEKTSGLAARLQAVPDPRRQCQNLKHPLTDVLVLGFCGTLAGCDDFVEVVAWARTNLAFLSTFLELPHGLPSHDTLRRVFALVSPAALQAVLLPWLAERRGPAGPDVHIDGKTMRRTRREGRGLAALHVVSAWAGEAGLTLGQVAVDAKSNEITAIPELLALLDLRDKVVTIDAMGCQKEIAAAVVDGGGDYVLAVKDNQPALHEAVRAAFAAAPASGPGRPREHVARDDGHGRFEERAVRVLPAKGRLPEAVREAWPGLLTLVMVTRVVTSLTTSQEREEVAYFISSLRPAARRIGQAIRGHWRIENGLHWVLDVVFREDARQLYDRTAAENVAFLNRLSVSILRADEKPASLKVKRKEAGWDNQYMAKLLGISSK